MTDDLRARILEALNTAPCADIRDDPEAAARHSSRPHTRHDKHQYHAFCALCSGEADTLTDAVMAEISATCEYLMTQAEQYQTRAHAAEKLLAKHGLRAT
jgi:hypothetical protein